MLKSLLNILIFLMLSFPSYSQSIDSLIDPQTLECAVNLVSEENRNFINEAAINMFNFSTIFSRWLLGSGHGILPLIPSRPALNDIRIAINTETLTEEVKYISFIIKDNNGNEYPAYGEIKNIEILPPRKNVEDIKVYIELLDGENIVLTGPDLYDIAISETSRKAFQQVSERGTNSILNIKIDDRILAPHSDGGFGYGKLVRFAGNHAKVYFEDSKKTELVSVDSIKPPLKEKDIILVQIQLTDSELELLSQENENTSLEERPTRNLAQIQLTDLESESLNQDNGNIPFLGERLDRDMEVSLLQNQNDNRVVFAVVVKSVDDDGMLQIQTVKNGFVLDIKIHPRQIIDIQDHSIIF